MSDRISLSSTEKNKDSQVPSPVNQVLPTADQQLASEQAVKSSHLQPRSSSYQEDKSLGKNFYSGGSVFKFNDKSISELSTPPSEESDESATTRGIKRKNFLSTADLRDSNVEFELWHTDHSYADTAAVEKTLKNFSNQELQTSKIQSDPQESLFKSNDQEKNNQQSKIEQQNTRSGESSSSIAENTSKENVSENANTVNDNNNKQEYSGSKIFKKINELVQQDSPISEIRKELGGKIAGSQLLFKNKEDPLIDWYIYARALDALFKFLKKSPLVQDSTSGYSEFMSEVANQLLCACDQVDQLELKRIPEGQAQPVDLNVRASIFGSTSDLSLEQLLEKIITRLQYENDSELYSFIKQNLNLKKCGGDHKCYLDSLEKINETLQFLKVIGNNLHLNIEEWISTQICDVKNNIESIIAGQQTTVTSGVLQGEGAIHVKPLEEILRELITMFEVEMSAHQIINVIKKATIKNNDDVNQIIFNFYFHVLLESKECDFLKKFPSYNEVQNFIVEERKNILNSPPPPPIGTPIIRNNPCIADYETWRRNNSNFKEIIKSLLERHANKQKQETRPIAATTGNISELSPQKPHRIFKEERQPSNGVTGIEERLRKWSLLLEGLPESGLHTHLLAWKLASLQLTRPSSEKEEQDIPTLEEQSSDDYDYSIKTSGAFGPSGPVTGKTFQTSQDPEEAYISPILKQILEAKNGEEFTQLMQKLAISQLPAE